MVCPGIVTNVTNFGAFVDIGVHQDGLVHISQLSDKFVKDPRTVVNPGDRVKVQVIKIDLDRNQIGLSMKIESAGARKQEASTGGRDQRPGGNGGKKSPPKPPVSQGFNNPFAEALRRKN